MSSEAEAAASGPNPADAFLEHAVRSSLVDLLDKRMSVVLRDGRSFVGWLRSFDQYSNVVLEGVVERTVAGARYADKRVGLLLLRGENIVLLGEIDEAREAKAAEDGVFAEGDPEEVARLAKEAEEKRQAERRRALERSNHTVSDEAFDPLV